MQQRSNDASTYGARRVLRVEGSEPDCIDFFSAVSFDLGINSCMRRFAIAAAISWMKQVIDPQENITIGNFLYALGLGVGVRKGLDAPTAAVNLLQQTSYDRVLGDVMLMFPGVTRLFEFKRRSNKDRRKELRKLRLLRVALKDMTTMMAVSRQTHLFVETTPDDDEYAFSVRPYLDLEDTTIGATRFDDFVNALVDEATAEVLPDANRLANVYIRDVMSTWGANIDHSSTGVLVSVGSGGKVHYVVLDDLADLETNAKRARELQIQRFQERELDRERVVELEQQLAHAHELAARVAKTPYRGLQIERMPGD